MRSRSPRTSGLLSVALVLAVLLHPVPLAAQTPQQPRRPAPAQPRPRTPPTPQARPAPPTTPAPAPAVVAAPSPQDVRFKSTYTAGEMKTESVTYLKGLRERYEFQDMVLLKQRDQKQTVQISLAAKTYLIVPDETTVVASVPGAAPSVPPKPPGVIVVSTTIVDTGERKMAFGHQARHVKTTIDKQPMAGACDPSRQRIETDGWYIDLPKELASQPPAAPEQVVPPGGCADQIQASSNGDPKVLGFPIAYSTTVIAEDGKPMVASMEVVEFQATTLDAALFEIPPGLNAAMDARALSKALSDVSEAKLVAENAAPPAPAPKAPGVLRIGVPELTNKTTQAVDTRALRQRLIGDLVDVKVEAVPMAAAPQADLLKRAGELGYDYVMLAEVTELKASKPGRLGGLMRAAGGLAGGRAGAAGAAAGATVPTEITESSLAVKLLQPDGKQRLSTTTKGKDGSGFSLRTGLSIAKFAGTMYMNMLGGPLMMSRLSGMGGVNLSGMGLLGNPALYRMQAGGLGIGAGRGLGLDVTAGAASYLMQSAMTMSDMGGYVGVPGQGPSYDESLGEAVQNAAKAVQNSLEKK